MDLRKHLWAAMGSWSLPLCNAKPLMVGDTSEEVTWDSGCWKLDR